MSGSSASPMRKVLSAKAGADPSARTATMAAYVGIFIRCLRVSFHNNHRPDPEGAAPAVVSKDGQRRGVRPLPSRRPPGMEPHRTSQAGGTDGLLMMRA